MKYDSAHASAQAALKNLYTLYDDVVKDLTVACRKGCSVCCTCNVTLTSLEGTCLLDTLSSMEINSMLARMDSLAGTARYRPGLTTNGFAAMCLQDGQPLDEENDASWGACPLLAHDQCPVYDARPFGCRCLLSDTVCSTVDSACLPSFVLTVNTVFMQVIENLDARGVSGNLSDVIPALARAVPDLETAPGLIRNRRSDMLMVPPEHRERLKPLLRAMSKACR